MAEELKLIISAVDKASGKLKRIAGTSEATFKKMALGAGVAGAAMVALGTVAVLSAAKLQKGIAEVGTLMNKSVSEMGEFSEGVKDIMARTGEETENLTKGLFDLVSAGVDAGKSIEVLGVAADLATAGVTDVSTAVDGMTSILNAFELEADQATDVADQFFQAQKFGKCFAKGTKILMHNGESKKVEDIKVGDTIMGNDNTPRNILALGRGKEMMYKITMKDGSDYTVNESHILSLKRNGHFKIDYYKNKKRYIDDQIVNVSVKDYLKQSDDFKTRYLGYKADAVNFPERKVLIDPNLVGIWLGDGNSNSPRITTMDKEIVNYLKKIATKNKWNFNRYEQKNNKSSLYSLTKDRKDQGKGSLWTALGKYNLQNNKHIPKDYKINSQENRLKLLAGLLDTDGHYNKTYKANAYEFSNKNKQLIDDFVWISRSCGFFASIYSKKTKGITYYRVYISGNVDKIPCKIKRKQCNSVKNAKRNILTQGFKIEKLRIDDYYGFEIDGNKLFVLNNFNVTHNTTVAELSSAVGRLAPVMAAAGASSEEMFAAISSVTLAGISTDEAVTSLTATMQALLDPQEQAVKAAREMGIELGAASLKSQGFTEILRQVTEATGGNIEEIQKLGVTQRGLKGILTLTSGEGKKYVEILEGMADRTGATDRAAAQMRETFSFIWQILKGKLNVVLIELGEVILPTVIRAMKALNFLFTQTAPAKAAADSVQFLRNRYIELATQAGKFPGGEEAYREALTETGTLLKEAEARVRGLTAAREEAAKQKAEEPEAPPSEFMAAPGEEFGPPIELFREHMEALEAIRGEFSERKLQLIEDDTERELALLDFKHEQELEKLLELGEGNAEIQEAMRVLELERDEEARAIIAERDEERIANIIENNEQILNNTSSLTEAMGATWQNFALKSENTMKKLGKLSLNIFNQIKAGIGNAFADAILSGKSLVASFEGLLLQVTRSIISMLIQIGIQRLIAFFLTKSVNAAEATARMSVLFAETFAGAFAATAAIPFVGPGLAPAAASAALSAVTVGSVAAAGVGAAVGASAGALAEGGIVTEPMIALIGEAGPEKVTPLEDEDVARESIVINFNGPVLGDEEQAREFAIMIDEELQNLKLQGQSLAFA